LAEDQKRFVLEEARERVKARADRMHKLWMGQHDGRNRGSLRDHHGDIGFCRITEDLARLGGDENEWSLYIVHVQKVDPCVGQSMGMSGFMPEVRRTGFQGPERHERIFGPADWQGWDAALEHGKILLQEKIELVRQAAVRNKEWRPQKYATAHK